MKHSILCVDDEKDNVEALERLFRKKYNVFKALSGREALDILKKESISLIISDQRMPRMTGVEFFEQSMETHPDTIRILLTGYTDIDSVISAINAGHVYQYLTKPWDPVDLANTVEKAIEKFELRHEIVAKNQALKEALDELKTLDDAKNHFMILINHELKTPLTVMLSFLGLLKETSLDEEQKKYLDRIETSTDRLKKLVDDSLELVQAETGLRKNSIKKVKLEPLVDNFKSDFATALDAKNQTLKIDVEGVEARADAEVVRKVLVRLTENAIKFGEKKSLIRIKAKETKEAIQIRVINQGPSLSKSVIQKIMKPFSLNENIMHHSEGLGLGLSLCQALLRSIDSQLEFESEDGEVTVSFKLPLA